MDVAQNTAWLNLLHRKSSGKRVRKGDVIALLRSEEPVPPEAAIWLADILEGTYKFRRGIVADERLNNAFARELIADHVASLADALADPEEQFPDRPELLAQAEPLRNTGASTRELAKQITAADLGVSVRVLEGLISRK